MSDTTNNATNGVHNTINWFEIPVTDVTRAMKFYSTVLATEMKTETFGTTSMAIFEGKGQGVHGALVKSESHVPSTKGVLVYFNGGEDLAKPLARVKQAGGTIVSDKTSIGPYGFMAVFTDTEGNRLALHSMK
jgi:predicted enzyme related to lactoylglutathione lyase